MSSDVLEIDLREWGGHHTFRSWDHLQRWIGDEFARWGWVAAADYEPIGNLRDHWGHQTGALRTQLNGVQGSGQPLSAASGPLRAWYAENRTLLHSEGEAGRTILDIREAVGSEAAAFALAFSLKLVSFHQCNLVSHLRGALLLAAPSVISGEAISDRLQRERRNLNERADRLLNRLEKAERERASAYFTAQGQALRVGRRLVLRRMRGWRKVFDAGVELAAQRHREFDSQAQHTRAHFEETHAAYNEAMHLQASVTYWTRKAEEHQRAEAKARFWVLLYFPLAAVTLSGAFGGAAWYILKHVPKDVPTPLLFIVSAGLASLAGTLFWAGRILTKLYFSEHHLRNDAQERAVMTTTYLALTKEKAAEDADRSIILSALFRNTPDGIVKDDGPADLLSLLASRIPLTPKG